MKDKHDQKDPTGHKSGHGGSDKTEKSSHHHEKHHTSSDKQHAHSDKQHAHSDKTHAHSDKHHAHSDKHHAHSDKHHDKHHSHHDKHHALKGATINATSANSSHPMRHRSKSFTRKDTAHSIGHGSVKGHGHKDHDRGSVASTGDLQPEVKYENTYKMLPDYRFLASQVKQIMLDVFEENVKDNFYDNSSMGQKCKLASEIIKEKVKSLNMQRFKFICHVLAVQRADQSMVITSRCLWDQRFDNSSTVTVKRGDYSVIGMVFAVYAE
ncbi:dynein light chain Tctex-type 5-like [Mytilus edulis]|uniref:dynein light chain Tctex-type 5-like n=1 Tax=Mytilus edulis TaxID=6550 RepID=UPI0039F0CCBE